MIFYPPNNIARRSPILKSVFLAGTINMGNSEDWQYKASLALDQNKWHVFNPRRKDWDSSWTQEFSNPQFYQQVNWELDAMEAADLIVFYFAPGSQSPITLLELGLHVTNPKKEMFVICPEGFWRKGNVDIVCAKYDIIMYDSLDVLFKIKPGNKI